jgi:hypothetical protein
MIVELLASSTDPGLGLGPEPGLDLVRAFDEKNPPDSPVASTEDLAPIGNVIESGESG